MIALLGGVFNGMYLDRPRMKNGTMIAIKGESTGTVIAMYRVQPGGRIADALEYDGVEGWTLPYDEAFGIQKVMR